MEMFGFALFGVVFGFGYLFGGVAGYLKGREATRAAAEEFYTTAKAALEAQGLMVELVDLKQ